MALRSFTSIGSFVNFLTAEVAVSADTGRKAALEALAKIIAAECKRVIGTYELGWPQLAEATQAERERLGYSANEPLLREGTLRDSIGYEIVKPGELAIVGSTSEIAVYQELGTSTIPARSFLAATAAQKGEAAAKIAGGIVAAAIASGRLFRGELRELFEIMHKLGHNIKEDFEHLVEEGDEGKGEHHK
jgi:phage gpG-like protein